MKLIDKNFIVPKIFVLLLLLMSVLFVSCNKNQDDFVIPPSAPPLSRSVIGYGILINSYTHILDKPEQGAVSLGYLREGAVVPVFERRMIEQNRKTESWVFVKGTIDGWLKEESVVIYENEAQAKTAAENLP
jgi:hypothetical protein